MSANNLEDSPERDNGGNGVGFVDEGPRLVARHFSNGTSDGTIITENNSSSNGAAAAAMHGEEEDDSVGLVFSADTGAGRAHTPQRLNRTNTPQR